MSTKERALEIINTIRSEVNPVDGHTDPKAIDDCWRELEDLIEQLDLASWPPASVQEALNSGDGTYRP